MIKYMFHFLRQRKVPVCVTLLALRQEARSAGTYGQISIMFLHKFQGFQSHFIYRGSHVLDYYLFQRKFNHFRAKKTPKKAFFFSCNFSHIWQAVQLEMTVCTIVTLGDVLNKLGKATFVPVGGRRKSLKKRSAG